MGVVEAGDRVDETLVEVPCLVKLVECQNRFHASYAGPYTHANESLWQGKKWRVGGRGGEEVEWRYYTCIYNVHNIIHVLMRDEKEERKK